MCYIFSSCQKKSLSACIIPCQWICGLTRSISSISSHIQPLFLVCFIPNSLCLNGLIYFIPHSLHAKANYIYWPYQFVPVEVATKYSCCCCVFFLSMLLWSIKGELDMETLVAHKGLGCGAWRGTLRLPAGSPPSWGLIIDILGGILLGTCCYRHGGICLGTCLSR